METLDEMNAGVTEGMRAGRYAETYAWVTEAAPRFPDEAYWFFYIRGCLLARMNEPEAALDLLEEAERAGLWYGEAVMRQSPSFAPLQGHPRFEALTERFMARYEAAYVGPLLEVVRPAGEPPPGGWPTVLALHGNGENLRHTLRHWAPLADAGWLLAAAQSSQVQAMDAFVWDDRERALAEVRAHVRALLEAGESDPASLIIAGFSMGGETALWAVLGGEVPSSRFVAVGPGGPGMESLDNWRPLLPESRERGVRGVIVLGEADASVPREEIRRLAALLNEEGIPCHFESHPALGHAFPPDFAATLERALPFLRG